MTWPFQSSIMSTSILIHPSCMLRRMQKIFSWHLGSPRYKWRQKMDFQLPFSMATKTFWWPQKGGMSYVFGKPSSPTINGNWKFSVAQEGIGGMIYLQKWYYMCFPPFSHPLSVVIENIQSPPFCGDQKNSITTRFGNWKNLVSIPYGEQKKFQVPQSMVTKFF